MQSPKAFFADKLGNLMKVNNPSFVQRQKVELLQRGMGKGNVIHTLRYARDVNGSDAASQLLDSFQVYTTKQLGKDA